MLGSMGRLPDICAAVQGLVSRAGIKAPSPHVLQCVIFFLGGSVRALPHGCIRRALSHAAGWPSTAVASGGWERLVVLAGWVQVRAMLWPRLWGEAAQPLPAHYSKHHPHPLPAQTRALGGDCGKTSTVVRLWLVAPRGGAQTRPVAFRG